MTLFPPRPLFQLQEATLSSFDRGSAVIQSRRILLSTFCRGIGERLHETVHLNCIKVVTCIERCYGEAEKLIGWAIGVKQICSVWKQALLFPVWHTAVLLLHTVLYSIFTVSSLYVVIIVIEAIFMMLFILGYDKFCLLQTWQIHFLAVLSYFSCSIVT